MRALWPCHEDLACDPELAPLALVEAALLLAIQALIARNPELLKGNEAFRRVPLAVAAHNIVVLYQEMHDALGAYRALLPTEHELATAADAFPF